MSETSVRTVVVTGGSRGIGRAVCRVFAVSGCRVFFNYAAAAAAAREVEQLAAAAGGRATGIQADVSDEASVKAFIDQVLMSKLALLLQVRYVSAIAKTSVGKIDKKVLREQQPG